MANLAYLLCWAFIGILLIKEAKRRTSVSLTTWIPTIMLLVLCTRTPLVWLTELQGGSARSGGGSPLDQVFFASIILLSSVISISRGVRWGKIISANGAVMLFYFYFVCSVTWSGSPADSLIRVIKDFGSTVIIIVLMMSEKDPLEAFRAVYMRCACILIPLSVVLVRLSSLGRGYARDGQVVFSGAGENKNSLGEFLLIFLLFIVWDHVETRRAQGKSILWGIGWDRLSLLAMGLWLLRLSHSITSLMTLIISSAIVIRTGWLASPTITRLIFTASLAYPALALSIQKLQGFFGPIFEMLGRDLTFTGRSNIWKHITFDTVNPLLGAGFWNFWGGPGGIAIQEEMDTGIPNAHNGYLDIYLDGGLIGDFLLVYMLIVCGRRLMRNLLTDRLTRFKFAFLVAAIIHNVTESSFARPSGMWFTIVLALLAFPTMSPESQPERDWDEAIRSDYKQSGEEELVNVQPAGTRAHGSRPKDDVLPFRENLFSESPFSPLSGIQGKT